MWPPAGQLPVGSDMWPIWTPKTCTGERKADSLGGQNMSMDHFNNIIEKVTEALCLGTFPVATEFTPMDVAPAL